jgi:hypothetical protein
MPDSKNSKISELTELTTPVGADIVPIVDSSDAETKKITYANLVAGQTSGIATNATNIATNAANIATNAANIASNDTDIATNTTAITNEETRALAAEALLAPIADATFTGTTTIPSADITTADFNAAGLGGELSWNDQEKTLDLVTGSDNVTVQIGQEVTLFARNNSGAAMSDGQVVMVNGSQGNKPTIALAQADTVENARKTIGIVTQPIPNNSNGFVTLIGKVRDLVLDSGTFTEGDVVYLSSTVAGGITNVKPNIIVELGHVLATSTGGSTNGVLEVQINNESAVYELEQELTTDLNVKDSLTITADKSPDEDAKIELIDKSTGATKQGGLHKRDGSLYVGTFTDYTKNLRCFQQGAYQIYSFPNNSGIRFYNGDILETYEHGGFIPILNIAGVAQTQYANQTGYYTKFGRKVTFHIELTIQDPDTAIKSLYSIDPTGGIRINGLPYVAQWDSTFTLRPVQGFINCAGTDFPLYGHLDANSTAIYFERGVEIASGSQVAGQGINTRRLQLNDFSINPFNFVSSGTTNKFRFSLSGVYMSSVD